MAENTCKTSSLALGIRLTCTLWFVFLPRPTDAVWEPEGMPVCAAPGNQEHPTVVSDGAGGVIVAWSDRRSGIDFDVYAQRITAAGVLAPGWPSDGVAVCTAPGDQGGVPGLFGPFLLGDGLGGAFIAWNDSRSGEFDIYVQRITDTGNVGQGWPVNGRVFCAAPEDQYHPVITADGAGGIIVAWMDNRDGRDSATDFDIYAQRINGHGGLAAGWPVDGIAVVRLPDDSWFPAILSDGAGGAFVASTCAGRVTVHRITPSGNPLFGWPSEGAYAGADSCQDAHPYLISDQNGGVLVTWEAGQCLLVFDTNIFAQRITGNGQVAAGWPAGGVSVSVQAYYQSYPRLVSDTTGGAIITWSDDQPGMLHAQRLTADGTVSSGWPQDPGVSLASSPLQKVRPDLVADGEGGAIVAWYDVDRVYAQHVTSAGQVFPGWPSNGVSVCAAPNSQDQVTLAPDARGGAIVVWRDSRNGPPGTTTDIYALRIGPDGHLPTSVEHYGSEAAISVWPNPFREELNVSFRLLAVTFVRIDVFDVAGRRVRLLPPRSLPPGYHVLKWDGRQDDGRPLSRGVYWLKVSSPLLGTVHKSILKR